MEVENLNVVKQFEQIKEKYRSFVLTTICRYNKKLREEIDGILKNNELIERDLIIQLLPEYERVSGFNNSNFSSGFLKFLQDINDGFIPYKHQDEAWKIINSGKDCVISTGTGSGKTESFLYPIIDSCLNSNNNNINSVIIYPLKALANDQGKRIGKFLDKINKYFNSNITYAIFDGDTPEKEKDKSREGARVSSGYKSEITTRKEIYNNPPNILLTNYTMLERIILLPKYSKIFKSLHPKIVALDELHYYRGSQGIDVSLLLRRFSYLLKKINNVDNIQWIGTSATLGDKESPEIFQFLKKLFDKNFSKNQIITPFFKDSFKNNYLSKPMFLKDLKKENISEDRIRAHAFFCSPPTFYRCLECNHLHPKEVTVCESCKSNLIFEIATCRQCGKEYLIYEADRGSFGSNFYFSKISREKIKYKNKESKEIKQFILSKEKLENSIELKICKECKSIIKSNDECNCGSNDYIAVYSVDSKKETNFKDSENKKFCPNCNFKENRMDLIVSPSKLSDANCSHIVFDELFMALPKNNKKLLIFTDNVQRSSKFAREIEETHLKNIARAELEKYIINLIEEKPLDIVFFELTKKMKLNRFPIELQKIIKKELFEEILDPGKKVASLSNRHLFEINCDYRTCDDSKKELLNIVFKIMKKEKRVKGYFDAIDNLDETPQFSKFNNRDDLIKKISKETNNENLLEVRENIKKLMSNDYIRESADNLFFNDAMILLKKSKNYIPLENNYYSEWASIDNIPMIISGVDNGKNNAKERSQREEDFRSNSNNLNVLVATPTLELGIDIGGLDSVGILYSPPTPAQYAQRIGRAGRSGSSSLSVSYLSKSTLDRMYYYEPNKLVEGEIIPPPFLINLDTPTKKSLFSLFFYFLLNKTNFQNIFEKESGWKNPISWENKSEEIISFFKKNEIEFLKFFSDFLDEHIFFKEKINDIMNYWTEKLKNYMMFQKNMKATSKYDWDIFGYLQKAGLLPDYAFGTGGTRFIANTPVGPYTINGYNLKNLCPPAIIDHNKFKFKTTKIDIGQYSGTTKIILSNYKECEECKSLFKYDVVSCSLCGGELSEGKTIIEPKQIFGSKTSFSIKHKRAIPSYMLSSDILENKDLVSGITEPMDELIYTVYKKYSSDTSNYNPLKFTENGELAKTKNIGKKIWCGVVGESLKTRLLILDSSEIGYFSDKTTFLNTIISAITVLSGCEDGEVAGESLGDRNNRILLFDNVEGGVGYVDILYNDKEKVLRKMKDLCEMECCESGCPACIGSYWRQYELKNLDKQNLLKELNEYFNTIN